MGNKEIHEQKINEIKASLKKVENNFGGNFLSYKFLEWLYGDANIYLDRKYERYLNLKKYVLSKQEI